MATTFSLEDAVAAAPSGTAKTFSLDDAITPAPVTSIQAPPGFQSAEQYDQAAKAYSAGQNSSDLLTALATSEAAGIDPNRPSTAIFAPLTFAGNYARAAASDLGATLSGHPGYGGNLVALANNEPLPADQTLAMISGQHPIAATAGKIAQGTIAAAPMMAMALPEGVAGRLAALGFSASMVPQARSAAQALGTELGKPADQRDADKITSALSDLAQATVFAPLGAAYGAGDAVEGLHARIAPRRAVIRELAKQLASEPTVMPHPVEPKTFSLEDAVPAPGVQVPGQPFEPTPIPGKRNQPVAVPASAPEPRLSGVEEIRQAGAKTIAQIQQLWPKAALTREQARTWRNLAWPDTAAPEATPATPNETPPAVLPVGNTNQPIESEAAHEQVPAIGEQTGAPQGRPQPAGPGGLDRGPEVWQGGNGAQSGGEPPGAPAQPPRPQDVSRVVPGPKDLTTGPAGAITGTVAAPGTSTVRSAETGIDRQRGRVQGNPGMTAEGGSNPPLGAAAGSGRRFYLAPRKDGVPDILDAIQEVGGIRPPGKLSGGEYNGYREAMVGPARVLRNASGKHTPDTIIQELHSAGDGTNWRRIQSADDLWNAIQSASKERQSLSQRMRAEREQLRTASAQTTTFQKDIGQPNLKTETLVPDDLNEGDEFTLKGAKLKVSRLEYDEDGRVTHVTLEDGKKYGTQEVEGGTALRMDKGSLKQKEGATEFVPGDQEPFNLEKPESVEEQNAREADQESKAEAKANAEKISLAQAKPLVGRVGDIGQKDMFGGGDLFSQGEKKNEIAGFGTPYRRRPQKVSVPPPVASTPAPSVHPLRSWFGRQLHGLRSWAAPQTICPLARQMGNALRHFLGQNARSRAEAMASLEAFKKEFDRTPVRSDYVYDANQPLPHNYAIIDALERDPSQLPTRYQEFARVMREQLDQRIDEIHQFAPEALQHLIQYYFPHLWQDQARAGGVMRDVASRNFAGRKEFMKQRTLATFREGLERGLKPVFDNPVDMVMAKLHSMDQFLTWLRFQAEAKPAGAMKFAYIFDKVPDGWHIIEDPSMTVQKIPTVEFTEAFDQYQRAKLGDILKMLGVAYKRVASLGGSRWGEADRGASEIRATAGAHEPTLWHELGHQIDWKFPELREALPLRGNSPAAQQLRKLSELRGEGQTVSQSRLKYFRSDVEKMAEIFRAYVHAPELFRQTAPDILGTVSKWLVTQPLLRDALNEMQHGRLAVGEETTTKRLSGLQVLGHWIMPDGPAQVVKNYLSPGLQRFGAYRSFKTASNLLNAAQLGLSGFHLGFTSLDAATSRLALAIEDAAHGDLPRAARTLASVPVSPVTNFMQGRRMMREALRPGSTDAETAQLVRMLEAGGGRVGQDKFWQTDFVQRFRRAIHEGTASGYLKGALQAPFALIEAIMKPVLDYIVPRQKLGVFADMARREIERLGPDATIDQTREAMRKAWDSVDNRMGQFVYDNLFYHRAVKDLALLSFRAYGWQLGKYREGLGALTDSAAAARQLARLQRPEFTHRMAYVMALPIMVGAIGGTLNYLMTGKGPQSWADWLMPRTGETDYNGNPVRLNLPSYMKDVIAYGKHPVESFEHSLNPLLSSLTDLYNNKDFYDVQIRNPDDPLWKQGSAVAEFAARQMVPFSLSGTLRLRQDAAPLWKQIFPYFGVTPVPQRITMTPAQELSAEITAQSMPKAPRTREQFDQSKLVAEIVRDIKQHRLPAAREALSEGVDHRVLGEHSAQTIIAKLKYSPLQFQVHNMTAGSAMRVWRVASPDERTQLRDILTAKIMNSKTLTDPERDAFGVELGARPGWWLNQNADESE